MSFATVFEKIALRVRERISNWDEYPEETRDKLIDLYKRTRMSIKQKMEEASDEDLESIRSSLEVMREVSPELEEKTGVSFLGVLRNVRRPIQPHITDVTNKLKKVSSALRKRALPHPVSKEILNSKAASILVKNFDSVNWESTEYEEEMKEFLVKHL